ncbi:hypothetical protein PQI07_28105 [Methylobacterium sp. 092160098-2]|uniref:hypothetical protein n=1 Tax=Methylobacterium sp. 092160098-2 TaxID=3025129 RepID=UPI0023819541|nr:hypothetical protein [Methylobacterium sp. 092160098-2]MDE4914533.1 hypothetical protein [Methylobacterium sp. 092160098-2]
MNTMFVRINEMWRRFFDLPPSQEMIDLNLQELMEADRQNNGRPGEHDIAERSAQKYCCTLFRDVDDPNRQGDKGVTVTSQAMCDAMVKKSRAKGSRPLVKGAC